MHLLTWSSHHTSPLIVPVVMKKDSSSTAYCVYTCEMLNENVANEYAGNSILFVRVEEAGPVTCIIKFSWHIVHCGHGQCNYYKAI